jgi:hypothetical protein
MCTGIVFVILQALPFHFPGQHDFAQALWLFDSALFACFTVRFVVRLASGCWPRAGRSRGCGWAICSRLRVLPRSPRQET